MKKGDTLRYNEKKLFNSEELKQYDEDGQKDFLGDERSIIYKR